MARQGALPHQFRVLLVVDADEGTRHGIGAALCRRGHEVVLASSGEQACIFITVIDEFDGLYTSVELGGALDGWRVGEEFHRRWPTCPVVYASEREWPSPPTLTRGVFLRKPFALEALLEALGA